MRRRRRLFHPRRLRPGAAAEQDQRPDVVVELRRPGVPGRRRDGAGARLARRAGLTGPAGRRAARADRAAMDRGGGVLRRTGDGRHLGRVRRRRAPFRAATAGLGLACGIYRPRRVRLRCVACLADRRADGAPSRQESFRRQARLIAVHFVYLTPKPSATTANKIIIAAKLMLAAGGLTRVEMTPTPTTGSALPVKQQTK